VTAGIVMLLRAELGRGDALFELFDARLHGHPATTAALVAAITKDDSGRGTLRLKNRPETLPVSLAFMPLFRNM